jgi:hypothetical protein
VLATISQFLDVGDIRQFLELRDARQLDRTKARSTPAFDFTFALVTLLAIVGLWLDVWSHVTYGADQSIFSEYHLLFYSATAMAGLLLAYTGITNLLAGYRWSDALPVGYSLSLAGIIFFGIDGVIDLTSHAIWGFETGLEALNSPTHIGLFAGIFLFASGPIRPEVARQRRGEPMMTFSRLVPFVLSVVSTLSAITFPTFLYLPLIGRPWALQIQRVDQGATLGVLGVFLETGITMGVLLWIVRRVTLPPGSITVIFVGYAALTMLATRIPIFLPIWLIVGILSDVAMVVLKPSSGDTWRFRMFGALVPVLMWSVYYVFFIVTGVGGGVWFTGYIWTGSIVQAAIIGYLLAFLMTPSSVREPSAMPEPIERERLLVGHTRVSVER